MNDNWGQRLRVVLEQRGETQTSVAAGINVSPQAVGKWVAGGKIDDENLQALAAFLQTNYLWLRYGSEALEGWAKWQKEQEPSSREIEQTGRAAYILHCCGIGFWELDLLRGVIILNGLHDCFVGERPSTLDALRECLLPDDALLFERFVARVVRSQTLEQEQIRFRSQPEKSYLFRGIHSADQHGVQLVGVVEPALRPSLPQ